MKVYLVTMGEYDDYAVYSVWLNRARAEADAAERNAKNAREASWMEARVEEHEVQDA